LKSWPNPSDTYFNIKLKTNNYTDLVEIKVFDVANKLVHQGMFKPNTEYRFGDKIESGVYIVKIIQANTIKSMRLVKY
jgi:hypothetical protein